MSALMATALVAALVLDQLSKRAVAGRLAEHEIGWHRSILVIKRVTVASRGSYGLLGVWALAVLGTVAYATVVPAAHGALAQLGLGCAVGGATSNLLDRLRRGRIVDFIAVGVWPTFNLADVAIVGGVLLALLAAG